MSYRALFLLAFTILILGVGGLMLIPGESPQTPTVVEERKTVVSEPSVPQKNITIASLNRDVSAGTILQTIDYTLSELSVPENSDQVRFDISPVFKSGDEKDANNLPISLHGFLVKENLSKDSLLTAQHLVSPEDPQFLLYSIDPQKEVAFRVNIAPTEAYLLDTLRGGDTVDLFSRQSNNNITQIHTKTREMVVKVLEKLLVLQVHKFTAEEIDKSKTVGYVSVKVPAEQITKLYQLNLEMPLVLLPPQETGELKYKGAFIRSLKGPGSEGN